MALRRELLLTIGALVLLNLLLAFGAIGLFTRMGPAIDGILKENGFSIIAAEDILVKLAEAGDSPLSGETRQALLSALDDAKRNVTEPQERPVLAALERSLPNAVSGDREARRQTVVATEQLIAINRQAMRKVDAAARRLGEEGAWAAVFIGFLSFLLGVLLVLRLQNRLVLPLLDLHDVLQRAHEGNRLRRCRLAEAPHEVMQVTESVNRLLDERLAAQREAHVGASH